MDGRLGASLASRCRSRKSSVRMVRLDAAVAVIALLTSCAGCGLGPRNFRRINHPPATGSSQGHRSGIGKVQFRGCARLDRAAERS